MPGADERGVKSETGPHLGKGLSTGKLHTVSAGFISSLVENILFGSLIEDKTGSQIQGVCKSYCGLEHHAFPFERTGNPGFSGSWG